GRKHFAGRGGGSTTRIGCFGVPPTHRRGVPLSGFEFDRAGRYVFPDRGRRGVCPPVCVLGCRSRRRRRGFAARCLGRRSGRRGSAPLGVLRNGGQVRGRRRRQRFSGRRRGRGGRTFFPSDRRRLA